MPVLKWAHVYARRGKLLDASREENAVLVAELRDLEDKARELRASSHICRHII
jgi:hypothetical protein